MVAFPDRSRTIRSATAGRAYASRAAARRFVAVVLLLVACMSATGGVAFGVVGGKTVSITAAPWAVVVWERWAGQPSYAACTGVIIGPRRVLTAGHCVMSGRSANPLPASAFTVEAGVSDFKHPLKSDHPQFRAVRTVRAMPGHIAASKVTWLNTLDAVAHDLAVLTLSRPLDLDTDDARVGYLPSPNARAPSHATRLVMAGFGEEKDRSRGNGTLGEVTKSRVQRSCNTGQVLCIIAATNTCWGDSGLGAIEPGPHPTVVGILSEDVETCRRSGVDYYVLLTTPSAQHFIRATA